MTDMLQIFFADNFVNIWTTTRELHIDTYLASLKFFVIWDWKCRYLQKLSVQYTCILDTMKSPVNCNGHGNKIYASLPLTAFDLRGAWNSLGYLRFDWNDLFTNPREMIVISMIEHWWFLCHFEVSQPREFRIGPESLIKFQRDIPSCEFRLKLSS